MVRTFIAIPARGLPLLKNWVEVLMNNALAHGIKWAKPDDWHVTIRFIGDVGEERISALSESLAEAFQGIPAGTIQVESTGFFGQVRKPRVLWAGVRVSDWLIAINNSVQKAVSVLGLPPEHKVFNPHLTLGRIKKPLSAQWLAEAFEIRKSFVWGTVAVPDVVLFKSELTTNGPIYSALETYKLKPA